MLATVLGGAGVVRAQAEPPSDGNRLLGLDVSAWQTDITTAEWATLKRPTNQSVGGIPGDGRDFVIIRASRGGTTGYYNQSNAGNNNPPGQNTLSQRYDDPYYIRNITLATAAGLYAGSYHFSRPDIIAGTLNSNGIPNNGTDEANHFIQMAGPWMRPGYLMPVHDFEAGDGARSDDEMAQFCVDFSNRIYAVMGIRPAIYTNGNYAANILGGASQSLRDQVVAAYPQLWSARWPNQTNPGAIQVQTAHPKDSYTPIYGPWDDNPNGPVHPWTFWQYASTMRLNGNNSMGSNTDVNVVHGDMEYLKDQLIPAIWMNNNSGNWKDLVNWNSGITPTAPVQGPGQVARVGEMTLPGARLPGRPDPNTNVTGADDTVNLSRDGVNITVTFDSGAGTTTIRNLNLYERLNVTSGSLTVNRNGFVANGGFLSLSGGTIVIDQATFEAGSTFQFAGAGTLNARKINLATDVSFTGASGTAVISLKSGADQVIDMGGVARTFNIANGSAGTDMQVAHPLTNGALVKSGAGTLVLQGVNTYTGGTTVNAGALVVNQGIKGGGPLTIAAGAKASVPLASPSTYNPNTSTYPSGNNATASRVSSLSITGTGQLDLGNSDLVIDYTGGTSPLNTVRSLLLSGFNGGNWNGAGIISTGALNTDPGVFALGYAENSALPTPYGTGANAFFGTDVDSTSVLIKFTWAGDLNLDGLVNFQDLSVFNTKYDNGATSGRHWSDGDFNYDGKIDFQDLSMFNTNYNPNKPSLPEPGAAWLLAVAVAGLGRRRRSKTR